MDNTQWRLIAMSCAHKTGQDIAGEERLQGMRVPAREKKECSNKIDLNPLREKEKKKRKQVQSIELCLCVSSFSHTPSQGSCIAPSSSSPSQREGDGLI